MCNLKNLNLYILKILKYSLFICKTILFEYKYILFKTLFLNIFCFLKFAECGCPIFWTFVLYVWISGIIQTFNKPIKDFCYFFQNQLKSS